MAVEIGQLIVNARVIPDERVDSPDVSALTMELEQNQHDIIERCVNEVLRILEDKRER